MIGQPLDDPQQEKACQFRASGLSQIKAYEEAGYSTEGESNNSSRFFRQPHIDARVKEIKRWTALMAGLDEGLVLSGLKTIAKNVEPIAKANLDDYFEKDADGKRTHQTIATVSRKKMALLEEVTVEEFVERQGEEFDRIRRTKLRLRRVGAPEIRALELLGDHLRMWPSKTVQVKGVGKDGAIPLEHRKAADLSDEELAAIALSGAARSE